MKKSYRLKIMLTGLILFLLVTLFPSTIQAQATNNEKFVIGNGQIGFIKNWMSLTEIERVVKEQYGGRIERKKERGPESEGMLEDVVSIYFDKRCVIKFTLDNSGKTYRGDVYSINFHTKDGIGVGSKWGEVRRIYPKAYFEWIEGPLLIIPEIKISCRVTRIDWQYFKNTGIVPDDVTIVTPMRVGFRH